MTGLFDSSYTIRPPDFVSNGTKIWIDNALTDYARRPDTKGVRNKRFTALLSHDEQGSVCRHLYILERGRWNCIVSDPSFMVIAESIDLFRELPE